MDQETFETIKVLLEEAREQARVVYNGYSRGQAGEQSAYYLLSGICRALADLRALRAMIVKP